MDAPPPTLGVAAGPPAPLARPEETPLTVRASVPVVASAPSWPRSAQAATAALLLLAVGLLGWHAWNAQRWGSRPTDLERDGDAAGRIDLNRADRAQLLQLPGVGDLTAERIEEYRQAHNGFQTVDDLRRVHGVGPALVERLRPLTAVEPLERAEDEEDGVPMPARPPDEARKDPPPKAARIFVNKPVGGKKKGEGLTAPIDVNHASAEELQRLPGVGPALSGRIIAVREQRPFRSVDELRRVPGIGVKTLERLRPFVVAGDAQPQP